MLPPSLADARYLNLATYRRSGEAVLTPIWFAAADGVLYAFSAADAGKIKRLRHSSRARIAACGARGQLRGPWLEASARVLREPVQIARADAALRAKYGWVFAAADVLARLSGRRRRHGRAVFAIEPLPASAPAAP